MDDFDDLLAGMNALDDFLAEGLALDALDEIARDFEIYIRIQQREADIGLTDLSMPVMDGMRLSEEIRRRHRNGIDALMWGTDYPHPEGSWPHTAERLDSDFRAQGTITANLPSNVTAMGARLAVMVGATATASTAQMTRMLTRSVN